MFKFNAAKGGRSAGGAGGGGGGSGYHSNFSFGGDSYFEDEFEDDDHYEVFGHDPFTKSAPSTPAKDEEAFSHQNSTSSAPVSVIQTPETPKKHKTAQQLKIEKMRERKKLRKLQMKEMNDIKTSTPTKDHETDINPPNKLSNGTPNRVVVMQENSQKPPIGRPKSGKIITAKLMDSSQSIPYTGISRPTSGISTNGASRPQSGVSRKSIPSRKDSLLSKQGGAKNIDETGSLYGKAEDDDLEKYLIGSPRIGSNNGNLINGVGNGSSSTATPLLHRAANDSDQHRPTNSQVNSTISLDRTSTNGIVNNNTEEIRGSSKLDSTRSSTIDKLPPINGIISSQQPTPVRPTSGTNHFERTTSEANVETDVNGYSSRPTSGKSRPTSAKSRPNSGISRPTSGVSRPNSGKLRPNSGLSRPTSGVSRPNSASSRPSSATKNDKIQTSKSQTSIPVGSTISLPVRSEHQENIAFEPRAISAPLEKFSNNKENSEENDEPMHTERSIGAFDDDSDEELMRLAKQVDNIYDPLSSIANIRHDSKQSEAHRVLSNQGYKADSEKGFGKEKDVDDVNFFREEKSKDAAGGQTPRNKAADGATENGEEGAGMKNSRIELDGEPKTTNIRNEDLKLNFGESDVISTRTGSAESNFAATEAEELFEALPRWHPPWQLKKEIIAHEAAIPELVVDPTNRWFATGSSDKTIRLWDINTTQQKLIIKAHKQAVRALAFGMEGHRFLYSTGDDRQLLCHDVEINKVISKFKGQSAVIYDMHAYQTERLLMTCGRDKLVKIFDTRDMKLVRSMRGHQNTVSCITVNETHKQVVTGSHDATIRLWDVGDGRCMATLYGHKKSVRALAQNPNGKNVLSASSERILAWELPLGDCVQDIEATDNAINSITINDHGVIAAGGSNGNVNLWDFDSGFRFQQITRSRVYESFELPITVFASQFDKTGKILLCSDACNVVKVYGEAFTANSGICVESQEESNSRRISKATPRLSIR